MTLKTLITTLAYFSATSIKAPQTDITTPRLTKGVFFTLFIIAARNENTLIFQTGINVEAYNAGLTDSASTETNDLNSEFDKPIAQLVVTRLE